MARPAGMMVWERRGAVLPLWPFSMLSTKSYIRSHNALDNGAFHSRDGIAALHGLARGNGGRSAPVRTPLLRGRSP